MQGSRARCAQLRRGLAAAALSVVALAGAAPALAHDDDDERRWARRQHALPEYKVDASWPRRLPNNWIMGQVGGIAVDRHDNVWVLQRPRSNTVDELGAAQTPPRSECCIAAPPVLMFDRSGRVRRSWGGDDPRYDWPTVEHGIWVDDNGNVWIGGNGPTDRQILKFRADGTFVMQIGHPSSDPIDSLRTDILGQVASLTVDERAREVYLADGYGNKRIAVYDSETGAFKRLWGAYGALPIDTNPGPYDPAAPVATQFRNPVHCVRLSDDGLVYVCDRVNNRVQVFTKAGRFVKEFFVRRETLGNGVVWDIGFSKDRGQRFLLVIDGENNVVWTLERHSGQIVDKQFHNGRNAGQFHWVHQAATDSQGNLYTGEVDTGKRVQKFELER